MLLCSVSSRENPIDARLLNDFDLHSVNSVKLEKDLFLYSLSYNVKL